LHDFWRKSGSLDVAAQHFGVALGFLHANRGGSATAEAFKTQSAGASKQLEDSRSFDPAAEAVEDGLFDEVWRRADIESFGNFQNSPGLFAASDAHGCNIRLEDDCWNEKSEVRSSKVETNPKGWIREFL
jgi:hypothetical protein